MNIRGTNLNKRTLFSPALPIRQTGPRRDVFGSTTFPNPLTPRAATVSLFPRLRPEGPENIRRLRLQADMGRDCVRHR